MRYIEMQQAYLIGLASAGARLEASSNRRDYIVDKRKYFSIFMCVGVLRDNLHCDLCIINKKTATGNVLAE